MRSDQKGAVSFLFLIDTSGSMHGQKISAVNAVLAECFDEMRDTDACGGFKIYIGAAVFHEEIKVIQEGARFARLSLRRRRERRGWLLASDFLCLPVSGASRDIRRKESMAGRMRKAIYIFGNRRETVCLSKQERKTL